MRRAIACLAALVLLALPGCYDFSIFAQPDDLTAAPADDAGTVDQAISPGSDLASVDLAKTQAPDLAHVAQWSQTVVGPMRLYAVWGSGPGNVFAVGESGTILHHDGQKWTAELSGTMVFLNGVGGGGGDVYAAGELGKVLKRSNGAWVLQVIPVLAGKELLALWAGGPNDLFVVGDEGKIARYDGMWNADGPPNFVKILNGVSGNGKGDVYAVGEGGAVLHRKGGTWSEKSLGGFAFDGVWSSGSTVIAVGEGGRIFHSADDGATWAAQPSPVQNQLYGVWGAGPSDVYAAGSNGTILHYDGQTWTREMVKTTEDLSGVWGSGPNDVFIVGGGGTILHRP
ncbi:MAG: hypothetical protein EXR72_16000 [Myxococcales bacterium]|nr:hypothetical protein [Myxococcales bacterium]